MQTMIVGAGEVKPAPMPPVIRDTQSQADIYPALAANAAVDMLVPVHAHIELTIACLKSIYACTKVPFHVIVLDDAPTDDYGLTQTYIRQLQEQKQNLTYCHSDVPFVCGNSFFNLGLRYCRTDLVATVMNSMTVEPQWETVALELMRRDPLIGTIGFKCLFPDGRIESAGIGFSGYTPTDLGRDQPGHRCCEVRDVEAVQWAFALHRRKALIGNLEEGVYHGHVGWDDIDNCLCLRKKGWKIVYCGQGVGIHSPRASRGSNTVTAMLKNRDNAQTFYKRWGTWQQFWEGSTMDVSHRLKHETKDKLRDIATSIQVLQRLTSQHEKMIGVVVNEALTEIGVDPHQYQLEMNPSTDTYLLRPKGPAKLPPSNGGEPALATTELTKAV